MNVLYIQMISSRVARRRTINSAVSCGGGIVSWRPAQVAPTHPGANTEHPDQGDQLVPQEQEPRPLVYRRRRLNLESVETFV